MASKIAIFLICFIFALQIAIADQPESVRYPGRFILRAVRLRNNPNMKVAPKPKPQQKKLDTEQNKPAPVIKKASRPKLSPKPIRPKVRQSSTKLHSLSTMLRTVVNVSQLTEETTFEEAIDIIRHTTDPPLPIFVMWRDIEENALVDKSTPIGIDGFTKVQLRQVLKLVLMSVGSVGSELEYVNERGIVTIASKSMERGDRKITKVYDIGELLSSPSMGIFGGGGMGNFGGGFGNSGFPGMRSNNNNSFNSRKR